MLDLVSLELNEINFDFVEQYIAGGKLPNLARLLDRCQLFETVAEDAYPLLEPWIQWPTVYTGKTYAEHKIFRLGDIVGTDHAQIWEALSAAGVSVGAISPMNAANRVPQADFFVPDPWTVTPTTGDSSLKELATLVSQAVNSNAHGGGGMMQVARRLLPFLLRYASVRSAAEYGRILRMSAQYKWARAAFLDRFLADLFLKLRAKKGTQFASLFLNAGAHIQHHHMYEAAVYKGDQANPGWFSTAKEKGQDPLLFIYEVYDQIVGDFTRLPGTRLLITTGLSQVANPRTIYQYRFTDHAASLARLGITGFTLTPRMSRDFLLEFANAATAATAAAAMERITCAGERMFIVEDRGNSLFCQIGYVGPQEGFEKVAIDGRVLDLREDVVLVSIENGIHRTIGFHIDSAIPRSQEMGTRPQIPLAAVFGKMRSAFASSAMPADIAA